MNRRKKSILFSATVASVGVVVGSLIALSSSTRAAELELSAMSLSDITTKISNDLEMPQDAVSEALETKHIIAKIADENILKNDPTIIKYRKALKDYYVIEYSTAKDAATGYETLKDSDGVKNVFLNETIKASQTSVSDENLAWGVKTMKLDQYASELSSKTNAVTVAVLDTGIRSDHEAFTENSTKDRLAMDLAYDFVNDDNDPTDDHGHGTMVSGVIVESTPNNVKVVPIKVLDNEGEGELEAFVYGLDRVAGKVDVINMSLGWERWQVVNADLVDAFDDLMKEVKDLGSISVAAAGNEEADTIDYPAAAPSVIAATSVNNANTFSTSFSNHGSAADFAAPGERLLLPDYNGTNTYVTASGTSFSSPFVASAVANVLVENPSYTQEQVYDYLKLNAEDLGDAGWDEYYGWGSLSFHVNKYADLTIGNINIPTDWVNEDLELTINVSSNAYNISKNNLSEGTITQTPATWTNISAPAKTLAHKVTISKNGTYTIWMKNANNETASKTFTVNKIDKAAPVVQTALKASDITEDGFKLSIAAIENGSGISKIEWYYKLEEDEDYEVVIDEFDAANASASATTKSHLFTNMEPGDYNAYAVIYDNAGNSVTSDRLSFAVSTEGGEFGGEVLVNENPEQPGATLTDAPVNPKTDNQGILSISFAGGAFVLLGAMIMVRRRR